MNESTQHGNAIKEGGFLTNIEKIYNFFNVNPNNSISSEDLVDAGIVPRSSDCPYNFSILEANGCIKVSNVIKYSKSGRPLKTYISTGAPFSTEKQPEKISRSSTRMNQETQEQDLYLNFLIFRTKRVLKFENFEQEVEWYNLNRFIDYKWNRGTPLKEIIIKDKEGLFVNRGEKITAERMLLLLTKELE